MFLLTGTQGMSFFVSFLLIGIILFRIRKNHLLRLLDYPRLYWSLSFAIHVMIFYVFTALKNLLVYPDLDLLTWSSYLRLHSLVTFLYIEVVDVFYWAQKSAQKNVQKSVNDG